MASFHTPTVHLNHDGWGPTDLPEQFLMLPFNPFGKGERLGKAADFSLRHAQHTRRFRDQPEGPVEDAEDAYKVVEDPNKKSKLGGFRGGRGFRGRGFRGRGRGFYQRREQQEAERRKLLKGKQAKYLVQHTRRGKQFNRRRGNFQRRWNRRDVPTLEASVKVESSWEKVEEFELSNLAKKSIKMIPQAADLKACGHVCRYDETFERVSTRFPVKLKRFPKVQFNSSTAIDDPVIQQYAQEYSGKGKVVLTTDEIIAQLMASPRSVLPWDLYFTRFENGLMFIDKRDDSGLEMLTVNETLSQNQQQDNEKLKIPPVDTPDKLSIEATAINQNFSQQAVDKKKRRSFEHPNPLWDEEDGEDGSEPAPFAYKYRKWNLQQDVTLIARTELHSYTKKKAPKKGFAYMTVYALNEANPRLTGAPLWRQKIDSSRGSVVANELKNNACKMGKWTAQTLLAGADLMKIGFVSRNSVKDPTAHSIIGTQFYKPEDFASQINMRESNMWAIVTDLIDHVYSHPPGKYVLMRDPNKEMLLLYAVPIDTFNDDGDEEGDDDYEDDEDEEEEEE